MLVGYYLICIVGESCFFCKIVDKRFVDQGSILSFNILVYFFDCVWLLCANSNWFSPISSGLSFGIRCAGVKMECLSM